jgi:hypothetical protein
MSVLKLNITMSLDGYIAGPNVSSITRMDGRLATSVFASSTPRQSAITSIVGKSSAGSQIHVLNGFARSSCY